jgi:hypothetical protein
MLLKNPAKELYKILKEASELSTEAEAIGILKTSTGISQNANLETIVMDGWVKIFGLIYNCQEILQELNEDELVISMYRQAVNTIGNDVARWMEKCLEKQQPNSSSVKWKHIPYLNNSQYLPLTTIGSLGLNLDKNNITLSDNKLGNICSAIKNAIDGLKNISEEEIDSNTRDEVIRKLESLLETIKNKRINNSDEIKGGVATIICDLLQKAKQSNTMAIIKVVLYMYTSLTVIVNVPDTLEKTYHFQENINQTLLEPGKEMIATIEEIIDTQLKLPPSDSFTPD